MLVVVVNRMWEIHWLTWTACFLAPVLCWAWPASCGKSLFQRASNLGRTLMLKTLNVIDSLKNNIPRLHPTLWRMASHDSHELPWQRVEIAANHLLLVPPASTPDLILTDS